MTRALDVTCRESGDGYVCDVVVGTDPAATSHEVSVSADVLARLAPGHDDPVELVTASFEFLLEREPRESILRHFDLPVIERYFPGYERHIRSEMAG